MKVYAIFFNGYGGVVFNKLDAALEEAKMLLEEGGKCDVVEIKIDKMSKDDYENLPEHQGW